MRRRLMVGVGSSVALVIVLAAQKPAPPERPAGGFKMELPQPLKDETGFKQIFDGKTLDGWDGDPKLWRVEGGSIVGETTAGTMPKQNSFTKNGDVDSWLYAGNTHTLGWERNPASCPHLPTRSRS